MMSWHGIPARTPRPRIIAGSFVAESIIDREKAEIAGLGDLQFGDCTGGRALERRIKGALGAERALGLQTRSYLKFLVSVTNHSRGGAGCFSDAGWPNNVSGKEL